MPDKGAIGPQSEQTEDHLVPGFEQAIGALGDGGLLSPAILSFAASSALARNAETGNAAEALFALDVLRRLHYRVHITALSPDQPDLGEREIVNTITQGLNPLIALLESLLDEIAEQPERK